MIIVSLNGHCSIIAARCHYPGFQAIPRGLGEHIVYSAKFECLYCGCKTQHCIGMWMECFCFEAKHWKQIKLLWFCSEKNGKTRNKPWERIEEYAKQHLPQVLSLIWHVLWTIFITCILPNWNWKKNSNQIDTCCSCASRCSTIVFVL